MYPDCDTPIHVMPKPVPLELFDPAWPQARRARAARRVQCMFMGGDFPRKGGYDLLEAWTQGRFFERADLTIVSDWPIEGDLPKGVRLAIGIRGERPEWIDAWRTADVFVMPTRNEAFGVVFQEAAAAGLPTIATRLNAVPEIVEDGITGVLVAPGSPSELVRAMESLLSSSERRYEMGTAARRKIEIDANPDDHRRRLVALISRAAQAS
jgi:glycosyltransferase involved in cell wall biosynthesis